MDDLFIPIKRCLLYLHSFLSTQRHLSFLPRISQSPQSQNSSHKAKRTCLIHRSPFRPPYSAFVWPVYTSEVFAWASINYHIFAEMEWHLAQSSFHLGLSSSTVKENYLSTSPETEVQERPITVHCYTAKF